MKRLLGTILAAVLFLTNTVFPHAAQANFWKDRKESIQLVSLLPIPSSPKFSIGDPASLKTLDPGLRHSGKTSWMTSLNAFGTIKNIDQSPSLKSRFDSAHRQQTIVHIQDIHLNSEAQSNIDQALRQLIAHNKVDLIALEGGFGPIEISEFQRYPDQTIIQKVADVLLVEKKISGAMHAGLVAGSQAPLIFGIDDRAHYDANVEAYRSASAQSKQAHERLSSLNKSLAEQKSQIFNSELAKFDHTVDAYRSNQISFGDYLSTLSSHRHPGEGRDPVSLNIETFLQAFQLEKNLNVTRVEAERSRLIEELVSKMDKQSIANLTEQTMAYRAGSLRHLDFYTHLKNICEQNGVSLLKYPAMNSYLQYVLLSDSINVEKVLSEATQLEKKTYAALAQTEEEKELIQQSRQLFLAEKLVEFSLTKEEWKEYSSSRNVSMRDPASFDQRATGSRIKTFREDDFKPFEQFYSEAEIRDQKMADNLLAAIKKTNSKNIVLVTGGFHTAGIQGALRTTYVSFIPKLTKVDDETGSGYLSVFNQEKTPLAKLVEGEKLFLSPEMMPPDTRVATKLMVDAASETAVEIKPNSTLPKLSKKWAKVNSVTKEAVTFVTEKGSEIKVSIKNGIPSWPIVVMAGSFISSWMYAMAFFPHRLSALPGFVLGFAASITLIVGAILIHAIKHQPIKVAALISHRLEMGMEESSNSGGRPTPTPKSKKTSITLDEELESLSEIVEEATFALKLAELFDRQKTKIFGHNFVLVNPQNLSEKLKQYSDLHSVFLRFLTAGKITPPKMMAAMKALPVLSDQTQTIGEAFAPLFQKIKEDIWGRDLQNVYPENIKDKMEEYTNAKDMVLDFVFNLCLNIFPEAKGDVMLAVSGSGGRKELLPKSTVDFFFIELNPKDSDPAKVHNNAEKIKLKVTDAIRPIFGNKYLGRNQLWTISDIENSIESIQNDHIDPFDPTNKDQEYLKQTGNIKELVNSIGLILDLRPVSDPTDGWVEINQRKNKLLTVQKKEQIALLFASGFNQSIGEVKMNPDGTMKSSDGFWAQIHRRNIDFKKSLGGVNTFHYIQWLRKLYGPAFISKKELDLYLEEFYAIQYQRHMIAVNNVDRSPQGSGTVNFSSLTDNPTPEVVARKFAMFHLSRWIDMLKPRDERDVGTFAMAGMMKDYYVHSEKVALIARRVIHKSLASQSRFKTVPRKKPFMGDSDLAELNYYFSFSRSKRGISWDNSKGFYESDLSQPEISLNPEISSIENPLEKNPFAAKHHLIIKVCEASVLLGLPISFEVRQFMLDSAPLLVDEMNQKESTRRMVLESFNKIMHSNGDISKVMWLLDEIDLLRFIVSGFDRVHNITTFDHFHEYVIHIHLLKTLEKFETYKIGTHPVLDRFYGVIKKNDSIPLLRWILMSHDWGKPEWKNPKHESHDHVGAYDVIEKVMGEYFGIRPLSVKDTQRLQWVVRHDQLLTELERYGKLLSEGAEVKVLEALKGIEYKNTEELELILYLLGFLSYADESSVYPYRQEQMLHSTLDNIGLFIDSMLGENDFDKKIEALKRKRKADVLKELRKPEGKPHSKERINIPSALRQEVDLFFKSVNYKTYLNIREDSSIAADIRAFWRMRQENTFLKFLIHPPNYGSLEDPPNVMILGIKDREGILSAATGVMAMNQFNIRTSWINSDRNMVVDRFRAAYGGDDPNYLAIQNKMNNELVQILSQKRTYQEIYGERYKFRIEPMKLQFMEKAQDGSLQLKMEGKDYPGALHVNLRILCNLFDMNIVDADIDTKVGVEDILRISPKTTEGRTISETDQKMVEWTFDWIAKNRSGRLTNPDQLIKELLPLLKRKFNYKAPEMEEKVQHLEEDLKKLNETVTALVKELSMDGLKMYNILENALLYLDLYLRVPEANVHSLLSLLSLKIPHHIPNFFLRHKIVLLEGLGFQEKNIQSLILETLVSRFVSPELTHLADSLLRRLSQDFDEAQASYKLDFYKKRYLDNPKFSSNSAAEITKQTHVSRELLDFFTEFNVPLENKKTQALILQLAQGLMRKDKYPKKSNSSDVGKHGTHFGTKGAYDPKNHFNELHQEYVESQINSPETFALELVNGEINILINPQASDQERFGLLSRKAIFVKNKLRTVMNRVNFKATSPVYFYFFDGFLKPRKFGQDPFALGDKDNEAVYIEAGSGGIDLVTGEPRRFPQIYMTSEFFMAISLGSFDTLAEILLEELQHATSKASGVYHQEYWETDPVRGKKLRVIANDLRQKIMEDVIKGGVYYPAPQEDIEHVQRVGFVQDQENRWDYTVEPDKATQRDNYQIEFVGPILDIARKAHPGIKQKVTHILSTKFSDLKPGVDYHHVISDGVIIDLEKPIQIHGEAYHALHVRGIKFNEGELKNKYKTFLTNTPPSQGMETGGFATFFPRYNSNGIMNPFIRFQIPSDSFKHKDLLTALERFLFAFHTHNLPVGVPLAISEYPTEKIPDSDHLGGFVTLITRSESFSLSKFLRTAKDKGEINLAINKMANQLRDFHDRLIFPSSFDADHLSYLENDHRYFYEAGFHDVNPNLISGPQQMGYRIYALWFAASHLYQFSPDYASMFIAKYVGLNQNDPLLSRNLLVDLDIILHQSRFVPIHMIHHPLVELIKEKIHPKYEFPEDQSEKDIPHKIMRSYPPRYGGDAPLGLMDFWNHLGVTQVIHDARFAMPMISFSLLFAAGFIEEVAIRQTSYSIISLFHLNPHLIQIFFILVYAAFFASYPHKENGRGVRGELFLFALIMGWATQHNSIEFVGVLHGAFNAVMFHLTGRTLPAAALINSHLRGTPIIEDVAHADRLVTGRLGRLVDHNDRNGLLKIVIAGRVHENNLESYINESLSKKKREQMVVIIAENDEIAARLEKLRREKNYAYRVVSMDGTGAFRGDVKSRSYSLDWDVVEEVLEVRGEARDHRFYKPKSLEFISPKSLQILNQNRSWLIASDLWRSAVLLLVGEDLDAVQLTTEQWLKHAEQIRQQA